VSGAEEEIAHVNGGGGTSRNIGKRVPGSCTQEIVLELDGVRLPLLSGEGDVHPRARMCDSVKGDGASEDVAAARSRRQDSPISGIVAVKVSLPTLERCTVSVSAGGPGSGVGIIDLVHQHKRDKSGIRMRRLLDSIRPVEFHAGAGIFE